MNMQKLLKYELPEIGNTYVSTEDSGSTIKVLDVTDTWIVYQLKDGRSCSCLRTDFWLLYETIDN